MNDEDDQLAEVISLVNKLKQKDSESPTLYPIFEGKVVAVSGQIVSENSICSVLDYLPLRINTGELEAVDPLYEKVKSFLKRAIVPFPVHPEVLTLADVKTFFDKSGKNDAYILEVKQKDRTGTGHNYGGFRYIKLL